MTTSQQQVFDSLRKALADYQNGPADESAIASIRKHYGWAGRAIPDLHALLNEPEKQTLEAVYPR